MDAIPKDIWLWILSGLITLIKVAGYMAWRSINAHFVTTEQMDKAIASLRDDKQNMLKELQEQGDRQEQRLNAELRTLSSAVGSFKESLARLPTQSESREIRDRLGDLAGDQKALRAGMEKMDRNVDLLIQGAMEEAKRSRGLLDRKLMDGSGT
ncbi:MAG: DUF2730 family protein [Magnetococcales bacterium]|nr:DUF2730 family protein [Magnetococcales bacterium]